MFRRLTALDETCVNEYWVYAALDIDRNEILSMRVYPSRNGLAAEQFIREVLNYCDGKPTFSLLIVLHGLGRRWRSLAYHIMLNPFVDRISILIIQAGTKIFFNNITSNPINRSERFRRSIACRNLTIEQFTTTW